MNKTKKTRKKTTEIMNKNLLHRYSYTHAYTSLHTYSPSFFVLSLKFTRCTDIKKVGIFAKKKERKKNYWGTCFGYLRSFSFFSRFLFLFCFAFIYLFILSFVHSFIHSLTHKNPSVHFICCTQLFWLCFKAI